MPRHPIKTGIKTALTQAERSQTLEKSCDYPQKPNLGSRGASKQIPINLYKSAFLTALLWIVSCSVDTSTSPAGRMEIKAIGGICVGLLCSQRIVPNTIGQLDVGKIVQEMKKDPNVVLGLPLEDEMLGRWYKSERLVDSEYRDYSISMHTNNDVLYLSIIRCKPGMFGGIISSNGLKVDCSGR